MSVQEALKRILRTTLSIAVALCWIPSNSMAQSDLPDGNGSIRGRFRDSDIVITTTSRLAGAIHSLTWSGKEFIDTADYGRQLQSAANFDAGSAFTSETFNPTEAGSMHDGAGDQSTSRLLHYLAKDNQLQTTSRMAFWLRHGELSAGHPAKNTTELSDHLLTKRVTIGYRDQPNVISYDVTFGVPISRRKALKMLAMVAGILARSMLSNGSASSEFGTRMVLMPVIIPVACLSSLARLKTCEFP